MRSFWGEELLEHPDDSHLYPFADPATSDAADDARKIQPPGGGNAAKAENAQKLTPMQPLRIPAIELQMLPRDRFLSNAPSNHPWKRPSPREQVRGKKAVLDRPGVLLPLACRRARCRRDHRFELFDLRLKRLGQ
jgi:hypothetical protein